MTDASIAAAVRVARACPGLTDALGALYTEVDAELATAVAYCQACGKCCDFQTFGHRLYVSTAELAVLTRQAPPPANAFGCPYQQDNQCMARGARTLGCRVFFCHADAPGLYERFHRQIQQLHQDHGVRYLYVELVAGVRAVAGAGT